MQGADAFPVRKMHLFQRLLYGSDSRNNFHRLRKLYPVQNNMNKINAVYTVLVFRALPFHRNKRRNFVPLNLRQRMFYQL